MQHVVHRDEKDIRPCMAIHITDGPAGLWPDDGAEALAGVANENIPPS